MINIKEDKNYISIGSWMGMMFVIAIPVVGLLMVLIWAFTGDNESRKNYFRAILSWVLILAALCVVAGLVIGMLGGEPALQRYIHDHNLALPR